MQSARAKQERVDKIRFDGPFNHGFEPPPAMMIGKGLSCFTATQPNTRAYSTHASPIRRHHASGQSPEEQ